jgi:hypothetical protein
LAIFLHSDYFDYFEKMKEKSSGAFRELSSEQLRTVVDTQRLFEAWAEALERAQSFRAGMYWKTAGAKQYLFRSRDRRGYGKSLGPRSPETKRTLDRFKRAMAQQAARARPAEETQRS